MPAEISWNDAEEIGIQLQEKFPDVDPLTVRFTDLHRYVTELPGFSDDRSINRMNLSSKPSRWPGTRNTRIQNNFSETATNLVLFSAPSASACAATYATVRATS